MAHCYGGWEVQSPSAASSFLFCHNVVGNIAGIDMSGDTVGKDEVSYLQSSSSSD